MTWANPVQVGSKKIFCNGDRDISHYDLHDFPYVVDINRDSLPWSWTKWCNENCKSHWAWWFDNHMCYVGFADQSESIWFALTFVGTGA